MVMPSSTMSLNSGRTWRAVTRPLPFLSISMPRLTALADSLEPSVGSNMCLNIVSPRDSGTLSAVYGPSVRLSGSMRRKRQRHHFDAFFLQGLDLVARRSAADAALGDLVIV